MKITFLGATQTVTGSKYLIESGNDKILVDCGLFQGLKPLRLKNWQPLPIKVEEIKAVVLTHAHIDHSGYLPILPRLGFDGKIYATDATRDLCSILLPDSGHIHEEDAFRANKYGYTKHHPALPLYTEEDGKEVLKYFKTVPFGQPIQVTEELSVSWHHAGHILGASFIVCRDRDTSVLFTGDMGRASDPLMNAPAQIQQADFLVVESTYGDRLHRAEDPKEILAEAIIDTVKMGGTILIPSFAVGRAQTLLLFLYELLTQNKIPRVAVYLDSPMAIDATDLMHRHIKEHRLSADMCRKVCQIAEYTQTPEESKAIYKNPMPKVIISASGMASGGRVLHHLKALAPSHRNTIIISGYQAAGTRGADILAGARSVKIHGEQVAIKARVVELSNMSAHADYEEILQWLGKISKPPGRVFLTHGELSAAEHLAKAIEEQLGWDCTIPAYQQTENL